MTNLYKNLKTFYLFITAVFINLLIIGPSWAQTVDYSMNVPSSITACGSSETFLLTVYNNTASTLTNVEVEIDLPDGVEYVAGSLSEVGSNNVQESNLSNLSSPVFSSNNMAVSDSIKFYVSAVAYSAAIDFLTQGNILRNDINVTYSGGSANFTSSAYNLLYAALSITNISPSTKAILTGDSYNRNITIINAGYGKLSSFYVVDTRNNSNLDLLSSNIGTVNATADTIFFSGSDFSGMGNGDNFFDSNESFVFTETLQANGCGNITTTSTITAEWGCEGNIRTTSNSYAHANISFEIPNINSSVTNTFSSCFGGNESSTQQITFTNAGDGVASNLVLDVFKATNGTYDEDIFSRIDHTSFQYRIGSGTYQSVSPTSTIATRNDNAYSCLGSNPIGRVLLALPDLSSGETMDVTFDLYHCNIDVCLNQKVKGWEFTLDYEDVCNSQPYSESDLGEDNTNENMSLFTETPADINDGQTESFTFIVSGHNNDLPEETGANYKVEFQLPEGLIFPNSTGDLVFQSGSVEWTPTSVVYNSTLRTVIAEYPLPAPFDIPKSDITINLTGDCSSVSDGTIDIGLSIDYIPDNTCSSPFEVPFICDHTIQVDLHCPSGPCEGIKFLGSSIERINYGAPDNDLNGLADGSGSLNFSKIKTNRAMVGDTIKSAFEGLVGTTVGHPSWAYGYGSSEIELGANLTLLEAEVRVYDASASQYYTCTGVGTSSQINSNDQTFFFDFSPSTLSSTCGDFSGFQYEDTDSIWVYATYKVTGNIGGAVQEVKSTNQFYASDIPNPTASSDKYRCGFYDSKFTLIGYFFDNKGVNSYSLTGCTRVVSQNYYLSIGNCCSNYQGGNLFPYEYRNWAHVKMARVVIPPYYTLVNSYTRQRRTVNTNSSATQTVNPITPIYNQNDTIIYNLEQYYEAFGGSIEYSDDGFNGTLYLELAPSCDVPVNTYQEIDWEFTFEKTAYLGAGETSWYTASPDRIRYNPTSLELTSSNPIIDGIEKTITWEVRVRNTTNKTDASNAWIHANSPSEEIEIVEVIDVSTGLPLTLSGDIYQLGDINRTQSRDFKIKARYGACNVDQVWLSAGYECSGYPSSFASFTCGISQIQLRVEPKPAELQSLISGVTIGGECSNTVEVTVEVASVKLAHADSVEVSLVLPSNNSISYNTGQSMFKYPLTGSFSTVADPTPSNNTYVFNTMDYSTNINENGLPGVLNLDSNKFQIQFQLTLQSNFSPGDYVRVLVGGQEVCGTVLPTLAMAYDPSFKFQKNETSGLTSESEDNWSVAWVDFNNDDFEDVFVTNYDVNEPNTLFKNNGDGTFSEVTNAGDLTTDLGGSVSSTWGDYDNDGNIDVFISNNIGAVNALYHNNGDETFTKITTGDIANYSGYCHNASWGDYDNDGYLDLFVSEYFPTKFNLLYHNNGDGTFTLATNNPISQEASYSIGATWGDYDNDGDLDLFIPNTNNQVNSLYRNDGNGAFTKITTGDIVADETSSVGSSWGDYNNDGYLDLFVANASDQNNLLYENNGDGTFTKITTGPVVNDGGHSHGSAWGDLDNDGDLDLMVTNDQGGNNFFYTNDGNGNFEKLDNILNTDLSNSFGTAFGDYDNDGDLDLYVANHSNEQNDFYTNSKGSCNGWTCFNLLGTQSNSSAIGAKVKVKATINGNPVWQLREITGQSGGGAGGQNSLKVLFGLGDATIVDSVMIQWPSGVVEYLTNVGINNCVDVVEESGVLVSGKAFYDANNNCTYDVGEAILPNTQIEISPGPRYVSTDANGNYSTYVSPGLHTINVSENTNWTDTCSGSRVEHQINVLGNLGETHTGLDFPLDAKLNQPDLTVSIGVTALRRGFRNKIIISYSNKGPVDALNSVLTLTLDPDLVATSSTIPWDTKNENVYEWNLGTVALNGSGIIEIEDSVSVNAILGSLKNITATISTTTLETRTENNASTAVEEIVGSIDPNDKNVFPKGYGDDHLISKNEVLTYKVRFQNIGNYPAARVVIVDSLSSYLDHTTIHDVVMSHDGKLTVTEEGILIFKFIDIELPDSTTDLLGSQGFVQFKIQPKQNVNDESVILNKASIQFDYNEYIETNTVFNTVVSEVEIKKLLQLVIYPNPARSKATAELKTKTFMHLPTGIEKVFIYKFSGELVKSYPTPDANKVLIDSEKLPKGMYLVKVLDESGYLHSTKFSVY